MHVPHAVIYVPQGLNIAEYASQCLAYCATRHYHVVGLVTGSWTVAVAMLATPQASVLVVAQRAHVDPEEQTRIEVVTETGSGDTAPETRRPRRV